MVVLVDPANSTTDEVLKLDPLTVRSKPASPAHLEVGEIVVIEGDGLSTLNELLVPASDPPEVLVAVRVTPVAPGEIVTL